MVDMLMKTLGTDRPKVTDHIKRKNEFFMTETT